MRKDRSRPVICGPPVRDGLRPEITQNWLDRDRRSGLLWFGPVRSWSFFQSIGPDLQTLDTQKAFVVYQPRRWMRHTSIHVRFDDRCVRRGHQADGEGQFSYDSLKFSPIEPYLTSSDGNSKDYPFSQLSPANDDMIPEEPINTPHPPVLLPTQHTPPSPSAQLQILPSTAVPCVRRDWGPPTCTSA